MRDLSRLGDKIQALKAYFTADSSIEGVFLFGSFGTPEETPLSDIDFGFVFSETAQEKSLWELMQIDAAISGILERDDIDVVNLSTAPAPIRFAAIASGELIFARDPIRLADFREQTLDYYLDYKPVLEKMQRDFTDFLREENQCES